MFFTASAAMADYDYSQLDYTVERGKLACREAHAQLRADRLTTYKRALAYAKGPAAFRRQLNNETRAAARKYKARWGT